MIGLDRFADYSGFGLDMFPDYTGFGLHRFRWNRKFAIVFNLNANYILINIVLAQIAPLWYIGTYHFVLYRGSRLFKKNLVWTKTIVLHNHGQKKKVWFIIPSLFSNVDFQILVNILVNRCCWKKYFHFCAKKNLTKYKIPDPLREETVMCLTPTYLNVCWCLIFIIVIIINNGNVDEDIHVGADKTEREFWFQFYSLALLKKLARNVPITV